MQQSQTQGEQIARTTPSGIFHASAIGIITSLQEWTCRVSSRIAHMGETTLTTDTTHFQYHMYKNNQNSLIVLIQFKETCITSIQSIVLQMNTIHV